MEASAQHLVRQGRARIGLDPDGILVVLIDPDVDVGEDDVRGWIEYQLEHFPGRVPVLIDTREIRSMTRAAQEVTVQPRLATRNTCVAILTRSPVSVLVGNFFMIFARPPYPAKLFADEAKARAWCLSLARGR